MFMAILKFKVTFLKLPELLPKNVKNSYALKTLKYGLLSSYALTLLK